MALRNEYVSPSRTTAISIAYFSQTDSKTNEEYQRALFEKGFEKNKEKVKAKFFGFRPPPRGLYVFPVAISERFDEDTKEKVSLERGYRMDLATSRYGAEFVLHPVLVELGSRSIIQYDKHSIFGRGSIPGSIVSFTIKKFGFEGVPSSS